MTWAPPPRVVFLAVNVNRYHLRVADVAAFSGGRQLTQIPAWHFLTGSYPSLRAVWQAYQIAVDAPGPDADVIHSSQMYFIDPQSRGLWPIPWRITPRRGRPTCPRTSSRPGVRASR